MTRISIDPADATELIGMLELISGWMCAHHHRLAPALAAYIGSDAYNLDDLRDDIGRFIFLLGGDGDVSCLISGEDSNRVTLPSQSRCLGVRGDWP